MRRLVLSLDNAGVSPLDVRIATESMQKRRSRAIARTVARARGQRSRCRRRAANSLAAAGTRLKAFPVVRVDLGSRPVDPSCGRPAWRLRGREPACRADAGGCWSRAGRASKSRGTTSSSVSTSRSVRSALTSAGMSTRSFSLCRGKSTVSMPARRAARIFSRTPPTGRTRPVSVTSPVIARLAWMGLSRNRLIKAAAIATPADGPSLGTAPAGTWMCRSVLSNREVSSASSLGMAAQVAQGGLGALAHRLAQQAGQGQHALAGHAGRLDEEDLAAGRGPGQPGGNAGDAGPVGQLAEEARRAEQIGDLAWARWWSARAGPRPGGGPTCGRSRRSRARGCAGRPRGCNRR